jgi:hypothetical protein
MQRSHILLLISALAAPLAASAGEHVVVQLPVMVDPLAPMPKAVKSECAVETDLGVSTMAEIAKRVDPSVQSVASPDQAGNDKLVQLTILSVQGAGGGAWSGSKSITMRAEIQKGGAKIASTILTRATNGGAFGGFKGTCTMLERVTNALGKDVAVWLARGAAAEPGVKSAEPEPAK